MRRGQERFIVLRLICVPVLGSFKNDDASWQDTLLINRKELASI